MFEIAGNGEAGKVYPLPASLPKSVTLAPRPRPRRPDGFGGGLGVTLPAVPAPCAGLWSVAMVCSTKVLNPAGVEGI